MARTPPGLMAPRTVAGLMAPRTVAGLMAPRTVAGLMAPRTLAALVAAGRIGLGAALVLAPRRAAVAWLGRREGARPAVRLLAAGLGARDVTIGVGTAWAVGQGFGAGPWLTAGAVADAVDCVAMLRARRALPAVRGAAGIAVAGGGALAGAWLARRLD